MVYEKYALYTISTLHWVQKWLSLPVIICRSVIRGINDEHAAVRKNAGIFDVSHMGEFILKGENALDLIQRVTTNDASKLTAGKAQYSCLPNENGGIVDDLLVYCIEENKVYMLVVNASNIEKDWNWIRQSQYEKVEMHNISDKTCLLAIQGPNAQKYCSH